MSNENSALANGARLIGETVITPGTSLLVDGQIISGLIHVGLGIVARATLGLPGLVLVAANSYSKTVSGKSLLANFKSDDSSVDAKEVSDGESSEAVVVDKAIASGKQKIKK